jgi:hypothetical protein
MTRVLRLSIAAFALLLPIACNKSTAPSEPGLPIGARPVNVDFTTNSPDGEFEIHIDRMYPAPGGRAKMGEDLILIGRVIRRGGENEVWLRGELIPFRGIGDYIKVPPGASTQEFRCVQPITSSQDVVGVKFKATNPVSRDTVGIQYWIVDLMITPPFCIGC